MEQLEQEVDQDRRRLWLLAVVVVRVHLGVFVLGRGAGGDLLREQRREAVLEALRSVKRRSQHPDQFRSKTSGTNLERLGGLLALVVREQEHALDQAARVLLAHVLCARELGVDRLDLGARREDLGVRLGDRGKVLRVRGEVV